MVRGRRLVTVLPEVLALDPSTTTIVCLIDSYVKCLRAGELRPVPALVDEAGQPAGTSSGSHSIRLVTMGDATPPTTGWRAGPSAIARAAQRLRDAGCSGAGPGSYARRAVGAVLGFAHPGGRVDRVAMRGRADPLHLAMWIRAAGTISSDTAEGQLGEDVMISRPKKPLPGAALVADVRVQSSPIGPHGVAAAR